MSGRLRIDDEVVPVLRAIACFGLVATPDVSLPSEDVARWPTRPLDVGAWPRLFDAVTRHRLVGFMTAAMDAGALPVTDQQATQLRTAHLDRCAAALILERRLLTIVDCLEQAGIRVVVLKGTAHAHLAYPDPSWRTFGDNDVLVRSAELEPSIAALGELGYERDVPELHPGFDRRFAKGVTLIGPEGDELDLHRTLLFGTFAFHLDEDLLHEDTTSFVLGGRSLTALGPERRILHGCYHAGLGDPDPVLASLRDLVQHLTQTHDRASLEGFFRVSGAEAAVDYARWRCETLLGVRLNGVIGSPAGGQRWRRRDRLAIASYVGSDRRFARKVLASLGFVSRWSERAALVNGAWRARSAGAVTRGLHRR